MEMNNEYNFKEIEVNILTNNKIIHNQMVDIKQTSFVYDGFKYTIDGDSIYLYPSDNGYIPTLFYVKNRETPIEFKNMNQGIPARALRLLWNHTLYKVLVSLESDKTNLIIIILLIVILVMNGIKAYLGLW